MRKSLSTFGMIALLCVLASCRKARTDEERRVTEVAEEKAQATTLTSAVLEAGVDDEARTQALRSEQLAYRDRLTSALDELDRDLAKARADARQGKGREDHLNQLRGRRETLKQHLDAIDRSTAQNWAALKATIDRDFQDEAASATGGAR